MEIHAALNSPEGSSTTRTSSPQHNASKAPTTTPTASKSGKIKDTNKESGDYLNNMFSKFINFMEAQEDEEYEEYEVLHTPMFGVHVNEVPKSDAPVAPRAEAPHTDPISDAPVASATAAAPPLVTVSATAAAPTLASAPSVPASDPLPLPDASLPLPSLRPPKNWDPDPSVLSWAIKTLDTCEWSKEDRDAITNKFSPVEDFDHIFTAVPNPPDLLAAIQHPDNIERDYLFKRAESEQYLYSASEDLACGLRPLVEALSVLKGKGMDDTRLLLAQVGQSMASASCHLSRGRRELGRRFVPLETAPSLYRSKPSHLCLFGGAFIDDAVQKAADSKKVNKDLIFTPRKKKVLQPFRGSNSSPRPYYWNNWQWRGRSRFPRQQQQQQYDYSRGKFWGRGRGRKARRAHRGFGGRRQGSKSSTQAQ